MKNVCHASFSTIRKFLRDVLGEKVSRGYLVKLIEKVSQSLERPYDRANARKHIDLQRENMATRHLQ